ncbi:MAG: transglycosylase SLT domain-containing protein [Prevotella sp.]
MGRKGIEIVWICVFALVLAASCAQRREQSIATPWGEVLVEEGNPDNDSTALADSFDLPQIQAGGELIAVTMSGPATCFDYKGKKLGTQYLLCNRFAEKMGVAVRVELCRDTFEMLRKVQQGEADLLMFQMPRVMVSQANAQSGDSLPPLVPCGATADSCATSWVVSSEKKQLIAALNQWYSPDFVAQVQQEERYLLSTNSVKRHVYAPMLNRGKGVISRYDHLFMTYSMNIRWDWRLMAAQCYQESTFDPRAKSWAGACGLMQIMPSTAELLGLPLSRIYDPESNIEAASRYLVMLERKFSDIRLRSERIKFVLACYNGGYNHIRDAMALAQRDGKDTQRWGNVAHYVLLLSSPQYYNDPLVRYGYMRGSETVDYVNRIMQRWQSYKGVRAAQPPTGVIVPQKAVKKGRFTRRKNATETTPTP